MKRKFSTAKTEGEMKKCYACGHIWKPRANNPEPKYCPNCTSVHWREFGRAMEIIMNHPNEEISVEDFERAAKISSVEMQ